MMNNEDHAEMMQEAISEDVIKKLAEFRETIKLEYENLDRRDGVAVQAFLDDVTDRFGKEQNLNQEELRSIRDILQEDINARNSQGKRPDSHSATEDKEVKVSREYMKEIVKPNLESAVINYVKFVQPFEGTRAFQNELGIFYEHQRRYLAEDLGIVNPRERDVAMEALMESVREKVVAIDSVQRTHAETVQIQKKIAREWIERVHGAYAEIVSAESGVQEKFWDDISNEIRKTKGLSEDDLEKINEGVRKIVEDIVKKNSAENKEYTKKESKEEMKDSNKKTLSDKPFEFNGMTFEGEQAVELRGLGYNAVEKRRLWIKKAEQIRVSREKINSAGLTYDVAEDDSAIALLKKEYDQARKEFFDKIEELRGRGVEKEQLMAEMKEVKINEGIATYDDVSEIRGEKMTDKMKNVLGKAMAWFRQMPRATKRVATTAFLVAGLTVGAIAAKDKINFDMNSQGENISMEQMITSPNGSSSNVEREVVFQEPALDEVIVEMEDTTSSGEVETSNSMDLDVENARVVTDTAIVEDGGSIEGSIAQLLVKHHVQIAQEHNADVGADEEQIKDWAKKEAHIIAKNYAKTHAGFDIHQVQPGTKVYMDLDNTEKISIDIAFDGGPHIVPEKSKTKKDQTNEDKVVEIEHIRTLLQTPEFNRSVADHITSIFDAENINDLKTELSMSVNDVMVNHEHVAEKITHIEKNALRHYNNSDLPEKNKSVQNYFIRLYAKAVRDDLVKEIFHG